MLLPSDPLDARNILIEGGCFFSDNVSCIDDYFRSRNNYMKSRAVRAGTGGDEAGIWAGDLVGTCFL